MVLLGLRAPGESIGLGVLFRVSTGISLYFGRGRTSIMSISFCVGVWWLWGRGAGKGGKWVGWVYGLTAQNTEI